MTGRDWAAYTALLVGVVAILLAAYSCVPARAADCPGQWVTASWYGTESGNRTANGEPFTGREWLVAHRTLPFGTMVRLTYNGTVVTAPVKDRGPYIPGRSLDVSEPIAAKLGMKRQGVVTLCMEVVR